MKKKTKIILQTIVIILVIAILGVAGFIAYLTYTWNENHKFERYIFEEGPWGSENTWVSDDGNSYLVSKMDSEESDIAFVTAYFRDGENWNRYQLGCIGHLVYINNIDWERSEKENSIVLMDYGSYQGRMKFDGTTFQIKIETWDADKEPEIKTYRYTITNEEFDPDEC